MENGNAKYYQWVRILDINEMLDRILSDINEVELIQEEFEDPKGVIRIPISKKNKQHNGQMKKYKKTNNDLQDIHIKLQIE